MALDAKLSNLINIPLEQFEFEVSGMKRQGYPLRNRILEHQSFEVTLHTP